MVCVMWNWIIKGLISRANRERRHVPFSMEKFRLFSSIMVWTIYWCVMVITSLSIATFLPYRFLKAAKSIHVPFLVLSIQIVRVIRSCIFNFVRKRLNLIRNYGWEDEKISSLSVFYYFAVSRSLFGNWRIFCSSCSWNFFHNNSFYGKYLACCYKECWSGWRLVIFWYVVQDNFLYNSF